MFHKDTEQIVAVLKGHSKKVTGAVYHPQEVSEGMCGREEGGVPYLTCVIM